MRERTSVYEELHAKGLTDPEIAEACGVSRVAVTMWRHRQIPPLPSNRLRASAERRDHVKKIADKVDKADNK